MPRQRHITSRVERLAAYTYNLTNSDRREAAALRPSPLALPAVAWHERRLLPPCADCCRYAACLRAVIGLGHFARPECN